jgi:hypothetical protein
LPHESIDQIEGAGTVPIELSELFINFAGSGLLEDCLAGFMSVQLRSLWARSVDNSFCFLLLERLDCVLEQSVTVSAGSSLGIGMETK